MTFHESQTQQFKEVCGMVYGKKLNKMNLLSTSYICAVNAVVSFEEIATKAKVMGVQTTGASIHITFCLCKNHRERARY